MIVTCAILMAAVGGCALPGSTRPLIKIGLVAPFEGAQRHLGYNVIYAVKLAIAEHNAAAAKWGYDVTLIALDDSAAPAIAPRRARELVVDPNIIGVVGHLTVETTCAALPEYRAAGLACVAPLSVTAPANFPMIDFTARYRELTGQDPNSQAIAAYLATQKLLDAIHAARQDNRLPQRAAVFDLLAD